jgi:hypothetical protein
MDPEPRRDLFQRASSLIGLHERSYFVAIETEPGKFCALVRQLMLTARFLAHGPDQREDVEHRELDDHGCG